MKISEHLQGILDTLPAKPGCYLMKNAEGTIIYVGKAISLKNRVRSYFHADTGHDQKTRRLVREIAHIEWILVGSELEALILEMNLIKKHRPKYNIRLKDDKRYPYIKIHWNEPFPKVTVTPLGQLYSKSMPGASTLYTIIILPPASISALRLQPAC